MCLITRNPGKDVYKDVTQLEQIASIGVVTGRHYEIEIMKLFLI